MKLIFKFAMLTSALSAVVSVAYAAEFSFIDQTENLSVEALFPKSSVLYPVIESNASQHVFLIIRDQNLNPVEGAASLLTVHFPDEVQNWLMPLTDEHGISQLRLEIKNQPPGTSVVLEFQVVYAELEANTRDSFRIWW